MSDASILLRDIAGDAAQKAANRVNPSEEQLGQIDQAAEDNTWHDVPNLSRENLRNQAKAQYNKQKPFSRDDAQNAVGDASQNAHPSGARDPVDTGALAGQEQRYDQDQGVDAQAGAKQGLSKLGGTASENIPDETKDRARDTRNRGVDYMKSKLPKERREQSIWRLKKMIVEIQGHQDCKPCCISAHWMMLLNHSRPTSH